MRSPWSSPALFGLLSQMLLSLGVIGGELGHFQAGTPVQAAGIQLLEAEDSRWRVEGVGARQVIRLEPSTDYYSRAAFHLVLEAAPTGGCWLVLEFLDRGYGAIALSPGVSESSQWSVARVNTGKLRRAVYRFDRGLPAKRLRVEGLDYLHRVSLTEEQSAIEQTPLVEPGVRFSRPSERVTTAAGDFLGPDQISEVIAGLQNHLPLLRAIGFNGVETYVRWGWVERERGKYDWGYYDAILDEIEKHGLQWFPMLLAGSGYALPAWLYESTNNIGFKCLEHGIAHDTQTIFHPFQVRMQAGSSPSSAGGMGTVRRCWAFGWGRAGIMAKRSILRRALVTNFARLTRTLGIGRQMITPRLPSEST